MMPPTRSLRHAMRSALLLVAFAACRTPHRATFTHAVSGPRQPWTHTRFDTAGGRFTFAVVSDLNGGERRSVFDVAVAQLQLLRPELVMSVGDLIDGPTTDSATLTREWDDFDARARTIPAPFFRVGGNHDLTGGALRNVWRSRYGPTYYGFTYKDVLFLVLDTEDLSPERARAIFEARTEAIRGGAEGKTPPAGGWAYDRMPERLAGDIGAEQAAYVRRMLAQHPDVRWTFLFLHKPVWLNVQDTDFKGIESALANRPYTVFSGHLHTMLRATRQGRDYFTLATTGGSQNRTDPMAFDHLTLVTMTADGPSIAHLRLDGILEPNGTVPRGGDTLCLQASRCRARR